MISNRRPQSAFSTRNVTVPFTKNRPSSARDGTRGFTGKISVDLDLVVNTTHDTGNVRRVSFVSEPQPPTESAAVVSKPMRAQSVSATPRPRDHVTDSDPLSSDFEALPVSSSVQEGYNWIGQENPSLMVRKNQPTPRPESACSTTTSRKSCLKSPAIKSFSFNANSHSNVERTDPIPRPVSSFSVKHQTVRTNLDRYRIEQITLRRIRFLIENHACTEHHVKVLDSLECSDIPPELIQQTFGSNYSTLFGVRALITAIISHRQNLLLRRTSELHLARRDSATSSISFVRPGPVMRRVPTTPKEVLDMMDAVDRRKVVGVARREGEYDWRDGADEGYVGKGGEGIRPKSAYGASVLVSEFSNRLEIMAKVESKFARRVGVKGK